MDRAARIAEHYVLEDWEYFSAVTWAVEKDNMAELPLRARRLENRIKELRQLEDSDKDIGGSLENKIRRMRELEK